MQTIPRTMISTLPNCLPMLIIYPTPAFAASSSAATNVLHAEFKAILIPAKVRGSDDGIPIFKNIVKLDAPKVFATLIKTGLVLFIPALALITQGMNDAKKIIIALASRPIPTQRIVNGIHAIGP